MTSSSPLKVNLQGTFQNVKSLDKMESPGEGLLGVEVCRHCSASSRPVLRIPREEICQEFGRWIDGMAPWEWYATLTFRDPEDPRFPNWTKIGWKSAHNALQRFNNALVMELDYTNPLWVACMELQQRGVPHWHLLVSNIADQRRMSWVDWWYDHYGIARILPYQAELGARYYLGKYLTKQVADIKFSPALKAKLARDHQGLSLSGRQEW